MVDSCFSWLSSSRHGDHQVSSAVLTCVWAVSSGGSSTGTRTRPCSSPAVTVVTPRLQGNGSQVETPPPCWRRWPSGWSVDRCKACWEESQDRAGTGSARDGAAGGHSIKLYTQRGWHHERAWRWLADICPVICNSVSLSLNLILRINCCWYLLFDKRNQQTLNVFKTYEIILTTCTC